MKQGIKKDFSSATRTGLRKSFAAGALALSALGTTGCATMSGTTADCVKREGFNFLGMVASVKDTFDDNCALAQSAHVIAGMKSPDGTPNMQVYDLALRIYKESNPEVRKHLDSFLKEEGTSIGEMQKFVLEAKSAEAPIVCENITDASGKPQFRCQPKISQP